MMYLVAPAEEFNEFDCERSLDYTHDWFLFDDYSDAANYASRVLMDADERGEVEEFVIVPLDTGKTVDVYLVCSVAFNGCIEGH